MSTLPNSGVPETRPVLDGVLVVELAGGIAGSAAGMLLADYGARVLKLEPPGGSPLRSAPSFQVLNRGKESVVVDAASEHDRARVTELLEACDLCLVADLELWRSLRLDQESIRANNPGMTLVMMPPYVDEDDSWPEDGEALSAALGMAVNQCSFEGVPVEIVEPQLLYVQGALAALAAVCGLRETELSGRGRIMTVSGAHAFVAFAPQLLVFDPATEVRKRDLGAGGAHPLYTNYEAADGRWIFLGALSDKFMRRALAVLEDEALLADPRIGGNTDGLYSPANRRWVRARLAERFRARTSTEWLRIFQTIDVPVAPVQTCDEWLDHPQFEASCGRVTVRHPRLGILEMPRRFFRLPAAPDPDPGVAPELGACRPEVDRPGTGSRERFRSDPDPTGPLGGLRVAILGSFVAGPQTARLLHLMGADVIKVEPLTGDPWRRYGFQFSEGLRSLAVDLRTPEGLGALIRLAETLDVVIDNFRPGYLASIGADDRALRSVKPDIITTSLTGFGDSGPLATRPGFDPVLGALSGMQQAQGGDAEPVVMSLAVNDTCGAVLAALATVLAVYHQQRTGIGQHVECSLAGASAYLQLDSLLRYPGRPPPPRGGRDHRGHSPWRRYYLAADGWLRLDGSESPDTVRQRAGIDGAEGHAAIESLAGWIRTRNVGDVIDVFVGTPVRVLRADNARQAVLNERYLAVPLAHLVSPPGVERPFYTASHVATIAGQQARVPGVVPGIGEQSDDILLEAGLSRVEIEELVGTGRVRRGEPYVPVVLEPYR